MPSRGTRRIWSANGLSVGVTLERDGRLVFAGQDLNGYLGAEEYEYMVTVPAADVPRVVEALGGAPGDDVLTLVAAHAEEIVCRGESTWVRSIGVEPAVWTWTSG